MTQLTFTGFGGFAVSLNAKPVTQFHTNKVRALLAYLLLEPDRTLSRDTLCGLLWPGYPQKDALHNLRDTLYRLRRAFDTVSPGSSATLLISTRQSIQLNSAHCTVDVQEFQTIWRSAMGQTHADLATCPACLATIERAVALYRGEILAGFSVPDAPPFEEWLMLLRELLHQQAIQALTSLALAYEQLARVEEAQHHAMRLLALDAYREEAHCLVIRLWAKQGAPRQALQHYETLRQILRTELDVEPSPETQALVEQIAAGAFASADLSVVHVPGRTQQGSHPTVEVATVTGSPAHGPNLRHVPHLGPLYGRQAELAQLAQWIGQDRCRLVAILGMGGVGKTTLAAQCVRMLAGQPADQSSDQQGEADTFEPLPFDHILWRSLVNAPPLSELLPPVLQILSDQQLVDIPKNPDEQIRFLMGFLYDKRVLLVLDNLESTLEAEQAGIFRSGYEPYGQLIQQMATLDHQSHLLLTSRERPRTISRLEGDTPLVQSLQLAGLGVPAGRALLQNRGIAGGEVHQTELVKRYSGNPLALKLVAETVDELYAGDVDQFLRDDSLVFADIRTVLDQHFARLTPLEQQILFWLAVEREPLSLEQLRAVLLQPPPQRQLVEALRALQRRSLIERSDERNTTGFGLQNVVTEYLTDRLVSEMTQEVVSGQLEGLHHYLHHHALLDAQANVHVRNSQARLLLTPIATLLTGRFGRVGLAGQLQQLLADLRAHCPGMPSYAGGNILNLLLHLKMDIRGYSFAHICVWRGYLQGATVTDVDFTDANLAHSVFTDTFNAIHALAISPDSQFIAAATTSGELRLWRSTDGQLNTIVADKVIAGHTQQIWALAFDRTGSLLASCSADQTIRLWDVESGRLRRTLEGHRGFVRSLALSPDGALLASGGDDKTIQLWDVRSGEPVRILTGHEEWVSAVHFHPGGSMLASGSKDQTVRLWNVQTDKSCRILTGHTGAVWSVAFSPDGTTVASGSEDRTLRLWNTQTGRTRHVLTGHTGPIRAVAFHPDGKMLASASADHTIRVWNLQTGQVSHLLSGHTQWAFCVAFSADGKTLVSAGDDQRVLLWDFHGSPPAGKIRQMIQGCANQAGAIRFSPQDDRFAHASIEHTVYLRKGSTGEILHALQAHTSPIPSVAFDAGGALLATGSADKSIGVWDVATGKLLHRLWGHQHWVLGVALCPNHALLASASADHTVRLWNTHTGELLHVFCDHGSWVWAVAFSADGAFVASASEDQTIRICDTQTRETRHILSGHDGWVLSVACSPCSNLVASGSADRTVRIWDAQTGTVRHILQGHTGDIGALAFSPDGSLLASAGADQNIRLWDVQTGKIRRILQSPTVVVEGVAFDRTGQLLASTGGDEIIRVWHISTGECLHRWRNPGPYDGMNITGVTGVTAAQHVALKALGAVESHPSYSVK